MLVELLKNDKLLYTKYNDAECTSTKYVFNSVNLDWMKYYVYPSKYYKSENRGFKLSPAIDTDNYITIYTIFETNTRLLELAAKVEYINKDIKLTEDSTGKLILGKTTFTGNNGTTYTISECYDQAYNTIFTNCLKCKLNNTNQCGGYI